MEKQGDILDKTAEDIVLAENNAIYRCLVCDDANYSTFTSYFSGSFCKPPLITLLIWASLWKDAIYGAPLGTALAFVDDPLQGEE